MSVLALKLAAALDQTPLIDQAAAELQANAEYQHAMASAACAGMLAEAVAELVDDHVRPILRRLVLGK